MKYHRERILAERRYKIKEGQVMKLQIVATIGLGVLSLVLYILLFRYEREILSMSMSGKWMFIIPIMIAFIFSFIHGKFTSNFWDMLGIKEKKQTLK